MGQDYCIKDNTKGNESKQHVWDVALVTCMFVRYSDGIPDKGYVKIDSMI